MGDLSKKATALFMTATIMFGCEPHAEEPSQEPAATFVILDPGENPYEQKCVQLSGQLYSDTFTKFGNTYPDSLSKLTSLPSGADVSDKDDYSKAQLLRNYTRQFYYDLVDPINKPELCDAFIAAGQSRNPEAQALLKDRAEELLADPGFSPLVQLGMSDAIRASLEYTTP